VLVYLLFSLWAKEKEKEMEMYSPVSLSIYKVSLGC
jgi:hypothetical protein